MWVTNESQLLITAVFLQVKVYLQKEFEKHGAVVNESHHDALVEDIFDKEDEDKDGFISAREFTYVHDEL
jgi:FK506-binding protein 14